MPIDVEQQQSKREAAQPSYIFRGHTAHIHSVQVLRRNTYLLTGDADGWVVYWKLETKRPLAVWKAHDAAILGTAEWGPDKIITHGRDNALRIWQLKGADASYSTVLPADGADIHRAKPWLLHSLPVNTLNFCAFTMCYQNGNINACTGRAESDHPATGSNEPICIAVPGRDDKKAEIYQFPDEKLTCVVPRIETSDTGMIMAVKLAHRQPSNNIVVIAGYEGGFTAVHLVPRIHTGTQKPTPGLAQTIYLSRPHTQPILSVDALPDGSIYFTSSADAIIAAHRVPELSPNTGAVNEPDKNSATGAADWAATDKDERTGARAPNEDSTAPEDTATLGNVDVEAPATTDNTKPTKSKLPAAASSKDTEALSPLSFPKTLPPTTTTTPPPQAPPSPARPSGLSTLLASATPQHKVTPTANLPPIITVQPPYKAVNTKHAGQQSLRVRSDGRLLVTGGWDTRIRIYSTKTLKEVAVLKWHKEGVYAVGFGSVLSNGDLERETKEKESRGGGAEVATRETGLAKLQRQREEAVQRKHWVVAGAKDGRVSLWEVF